MVESAGPNWRSRNIVFIAVISQTVVRYFCVSKICWVFMCPVYAVTAYVYVHTCTHIICVGLPLQAISDLHHYSSKCLV